MSLNLANILLGIYEKIPLGLINFFAPIYYCIPLSKRYGAVFWKQYQLLKEKEWIDGKERKKMEDQLFLEIVGHAFKNVPYYQKLCIQKEVNLNEIKSVEDIIKLPFLTKEIIRNNIDGLISTNVKKENLVHVTTSGSTGQPLKFYQNPEIKMREWAYTNYLWGRAGYFPDSSRLVLRGKVFRNKKAKGSVWQWDAFKRELSCDIFDMTDKNVAVYCSKIEQYKPEFIHGYMSAIVILCKYIEHHEIQHKFKAVLATSETILPEQREYVESVLKTRVFSFYGHSERLVIAAECEKSTEYHIEPAYGYAEIIDENGNPITESGRKGELVTTGFLNYSMPLIRYRTGDIAEWGSEEECCLCGRSHKRINNIAGRWNQDVLVKRNGALVTLTALNMHSAVFKNINKFQFIQTEPGEIILNIVPAKEYDKSDSFEIVQQIVEKMGEDTNVHIKLVDNIAVSSNGKYKIIDQKISVAISGCI